MKEITDKDFLCAECIERADCYVNPVYSWYKFHTCWLCSKKVETMRVHYIQVKEKSDE